MHLHIVKQRRARASGSLTKAAPVVDDRDALRFARHESEGADIVVVIGDDRDPMGEQHAGRIELATVETVDRAVSRDARRMVVSRLGAGSRERVAEPLARQNTSVEEALLLFRALQAQPLDHEKVVLRDLADRSVGARERGDHARNGSRTHAGAAVSLRHGDREQTRVGDELHLLVREDAISITGGGAYGKFCGNFLGHCKRLRVVSNPAGWRAPQGRRTKFIGVDVKRRERGRHEGSLRRARCQLQAWRGGATPFNRWLPTWKYFQRTGSCSVWVRALRQCRSKLYCPSVERVPPSSCSLLAARIAISVVRTLASATLTAVSPTASSLGLSRIPSMARPA